MITCKILKDSVNPAGDRITTWELTYPRFIHSELMTHRMLAKNAASSRAIPVEKMIQAVRENPAMFEQYGRANKGMTAMDLMSPAEVMNFNEAWISTGYACSAFAEDWGKDVAKQIVNRILEPWMHMTIICTGTDWHNFYALRAHPAAQPEFQVLAYRMLDTYIKAVPTPLPWGGWHLPLVAEDVRIFRAGPILEAWKKASVARCARVSYTRHDAENTPDKNDALHDRLLASGHMSPFEHQAMADPEVAHRGDNETIHHGCFKGWKPYRKFLPNENRQNVDLAAILNAKPDWVTI